VTILTIASELSGHPDRRLPDQRGAHQYLRLFQPSVGALPVTPNFVAEIGDVDLRKPHGLSLHAAVRIASHQRKALDRLCRTITRPGLANERLSRNGKGQVVLQLRSAYRDGSTHIVMSAQEFMQRLAARVARPRLHLIGFHGVLAPHAKLRAAIVPGRPEAAHAGPAPSTRSVARP